MKVSARKILVEPMIHKTRLSEWFPNWALLVFRLLPGINRFRVRVPAWHLWRNARATSILRGERLP